MSDIFAQTDFRLVELIWYDFLRYGTILVRCGTIFLPMVRFSYLRYDFGKSRYDLVICGYDFPP